MTTPTHDLPTPEGGPDPGGTGIAGGPSRDMDEPPKGGSFLGYLLRKLGGALTSMILVIVLGFFAFRMLPGDPVLKIAKERPMSPAQIAELRSQYGLDKPVIVQFWDYLVGIFTGDFGESYVYRKPVASLIVEYLGPTLLLTATAAILSIGLGLWLGQLSGWRRNSVFDKIMSSTSLVFWSVPTFWLGLILLMIFGGTLQWLPTGGMITPGLDPWSFAGMVDIVKHLILPVITMVAVVYAQYLMVMRASLIEEMSEDYLTTARAKGLTEDEVRRKHAVPNALLPTVTVVFMHIGGLIAGAVTVEAVFSWPGLGKLTFEAISGPDLPLLQGTFVVFSGIIIVMNLAADIVYRFLDPRVRRA
ncbi:ABC transporter permease [Brevibacterium sp. BDJS002]|uniref:ABC transporter permease n=1 Tax=Brevibacterium sp. BDJS002 TaxID=3020906 RepID=UPI0023079123|nr:ABC transporter permease [Brevibacterium sp. BDJS002]MDN5738654.1 ABC transporter permease [Brevibacterium aurantiacum]MDN5774671.1 ABC transporter permease [Brevibacterium aurantiacum]WCE39602.1 ABC transporter permease [Brevibacterium sp. BDJS002]